MKRKISLLLILVMVFSLTVSAAVIETPMLPIKPVENTKVSLSSNAGNTVIAGTTVDFSTEVSGISKSNAVAYAHFSYEYADSLEFCGEIMLNGLSDWTVSNVRDRANVLSFDISGPATSSTFAVKFSFEVSLTPGETPYVSFDDVELYNENDNKISVTTSARNNSFGIKTVVPVFDNLGASICINNTPAIRFGMRVEKDSVYKKAFGSGNYTYSSSDNIKFGMLCIAEEAYKGGDLTVDTKSVHVENFKTPIIDNSNELVFAYKIDNLGSNVISFVTRPFISYELEDGDVIYFYGETKTRNAEYVAEIELKSATDDKIKELLNKFITK